MSNRRRRRLRVYHRPSEPAWQLFARRAGARWRARGPNWRPSRWPRRTGRWIARRIRLLVVLAVLVAAGTSGTVLAVALTRTVPFSYRIVYQVTTPLATPAVTTDILTVHRPFLASMITRVGAPPGGAVQGGDVIDGAFYLLSASSGKVTAQELSPDTGNLGGIDLRLQPALSVAVAGHLLRQGGMATVLGRPCTLYLSANPLDGGSWQPPSGGSTVTSCVTAQGFLLRSVWILNGKLVQQQVAVSFTEHPTGPFTPLAGATVSPANGQLLSAAVTPLGPHTPAPLLVKTPAAPPGLHLARSLLVTELDSSSGIPTPTATDRRLVYTDGNNLVVLTERNLIDPGAATSTAGGIPVVLGALGHGTLVPGPDGLSVTATLSSGEEVDVTGTISESALLAWIRTLRPVG